MPYPNSGENKDHYISRCMSELSKEGRPQKQSAAICYSYWRKHGEGKNVNEIISIDETYLLIEEVQPYTHASLIASDQISIANKMRMRPQGVIITDTYNHPVFPINYPRIDDAYFSLPTIQSRYQELYSGLRLDFLPWHFTVEFLSNDYYIFNTRPLDMQFPVGTDDALRNIKNNDIELNDMSQKYFKERPFDLRDAIHIAVIGDSTKDVYTKRLYETIGRGCIGPLLRYFRLPEMYGQKVIGLNLGKKFIASQLDLFLKQH